MSMAGKIFLLCNFAIFFLVEVNSKNLRQRRHDTEDELDATVGVEEIEQLLEEQLNISQEEVRGILSTLFGISNNNLALPPPVVTPVPTTILSALASRNRTAIINFLTSDNLLSSIIRANDLGLNPAWLRIALQKCAKVNTNLLTVVLPTSANGLREPKMYYFENSTSNVKPWMSAQDWCSERGMDLVTVNDAFENAVIIEKLKAILSGATVGSVDNQFWIGLNDLARPDTVWTWTGDASSRFLDWHTTPVNPVVTAGFNCAAYTQLTSADNIHFSNLDCLGNPPATKRFICEVSDACVALFMSRYKPFYGFLPLTN